MNPDQLRDASMLELFAMEADSQAGVLGDCLLALERDPTAAAHLEACMRAAHSLKGAARIVGLDGGVRVAHLMEECLVAAQGDELILTPLHIDVLLTGTDLLQRIGRPPDGDPAWAERAGKPEIEAFGQRLQDLLDDDDGAWTKSDFGILAASEPDHLIAVDPRPGSDPVADSGPHPAAPAPAPTQGEPATSVDNHERMLRVTAETLDQLLSTSGASLVESHWLKPFGDSLQHTRRLQMKAMRALDELQELLAGDDAGSKDGARPRMQDPQAAQGALGEARQLFAQCHEALSRHIGELDQFDRRQSRLTRRLYDSALACRMRPLADGIGGYSRMVRDLARALGKQARLEIAGETTQVDRDILERLEAPLAHILRNAVDHGLEDPDTRIRVGKPVEGRIALHARHSAGQLLIEIADDGRGIDLDALRRRIVQRKLADQGTVATLSSAELLEFLLLPGFTTRDHADEVSGRGVGLDAVREMIRQVHGRLRITQQTGHGMRFLLELPLTLSVVRAMLVEIAGEVYAFPLAHIVRVASVRQEDIDRLENREHFHFRYAGLSVGLVSTARVLGKTDRFMADGPVPVVVVGDGDRQYGLAVDRLLGERMLVVQPLAPALKKIQDIAAASLTDDGTPVLIFDVGDLLRSVEKLVADGDPGTAAPRAAQTAPHRRKRVLVVDDSLTVRELERKLLANLGYDVTVAVDGMDGWNMLRAQDFDLLITDIDMPRMDGIELVTLVRQDARLRALPVMVVSYKDRELDRQRGLQAGADYYLAKGSFHDVALLGAVRDLIGEAGT